ncbi:hypothetical protein [Planctomycetes bacterium TBK1r]|uniref:hypothetical protein n=1 Tax=Stieleria magnilauensis TaxID=2527963 RepID=UPI00119E5F74
MRQLRISAYICACFGFLTLGCQRNVTITNPDGEAASLGTFWMAPMQIMQWAIPLTYFVFAVAALIALFRYKSIASLLLSIAFVSILTGTIGSIAAEYPMRGATIDDINSGAAHPIVWLLNLSNSLVAAGYSISVLGGLAALRQVTHQQRIENRAEPWVSG